MFRRTFISAHKDKFKFYKLILEFNHIACACVSIQIRITLFSFYQKKKNLGLTQGILKQDEQNHR